MSRYLYVEILRQVCPVQEYDNFSFFLLGGFDAMEIYTGKSFEELKKTYERGQHDAPSLFDRQPVFLYSGVDVDDINDTSSIFSRSGKYESYPLVMTLFQLNKYKLAADINMDSPDQLIDRFSQLMKQEIEGQFRKNKEFDKDIQYQVFWNLGESDIVVIFRSKTLKQVADILHAFRMKKYKKRDSIQVSSTCSHCAFPKTADLYGLQDKEQENRITELLTTWLDLEFKAKEKPEFISLVNTSIGYNDIDSKMKLLFGEWDYMFYGKESGEKEVLNFLRKIFLVLVRGKDKGEEIFPFRLSYTIPAIQSKLSDIDEDPEEDVFGYVYEENDAWITDLATAMDELADKVRDLLETGRGDRLASSIESYRNSMIGLAKFLYRLKAGRFEEDLYIYIQPVFVRLKAITESFTKNICEMDCEKDEMQMERLVREFIYDTSDLIERIQHLFSVMAVSPHTFLETYGSNMRSLAASDKLLDAYQGIVQFLKKNFPDKLGSENTERDILVLPYRRAQSAHTLLYQQADPRNRISYIQIDFTKMFDVKSSVFMLLHECGHHLGDRLREERFRCYADAAMAMAFEWIGMEAYLREPISTFVSRANKEKSKQARDKEEDLLFFQLPDSRKEYYKSRIQMDVLKGIQWLVDEYGYDNCVKEYYESRNAPYSYLKEIYQNYYRKTIVDVMQSAYIPQVFGILTDEPKDSAAIEIQQQSIDDLSDAISELIGEPLKKIAEELCQEVAKEQKNTREALRIKTIYTDTSLFARNIAEKSRFFVEMKLQSEELDALFDVFSDIYSDIFAISMLKLDAAEYMRCIPRLLGIDLDDILKGTTSLFRVFVVAKTLWGRISTEEFVKMLDCEVSLQNSVLKEWKSFEKKSYRSYLEAYAKLCREKILSLIQEAQQNGEGTSLNYLKQMFEEDSGKSANAIFHFYQYLMRGGQKDEIS